MNPELVDQIWEDLKANREVADALKVPETGLEDLLESSRLPIRYWRLGGGHRVADNEQTDKEIVPAPGAYEGERAEAYSEYVAALARDDPETRRFRQDYLDGTPVAQDQAHALLTSPAAQMFTHDEFHEHGIPLIGHRAHVVSKQVSPTPAKSWSLEVVLKIEWPGGVYEGPFSMRRRGSRPSSPRFERLSFPDTGRQTFSQVPVWPFSVLDELRKLSESLARRYHWREHALVTWFLLTDEPLWVSPLTGQVHLPSGPAFKYGTITITVQPWVSVDTVEKFYRDLQRQVLGHNKRRLSERNLALLRFVLGHIESVHPRSLLEYRSFAKRRGVELDDNGLPKTKLPMTELVGPSWRKLLEGWNRRYPIDHMWHYKSVQNFQKDFRRAETAVARPDYTLPENGSAGSDLSR
jgi:hypothetical protein